MKKTMLIIVAALFLLGVQKLFAEDPIPYCDDSCLPQAPWANGEDIIQPLPSCPQCSISVWYKYRLNTCFEPAKFEIIMEEFAYYGDGCVDCIESQYNLNNLAWWVFHQLVAYNPYTKDPQNLSPNECIEMLQAGFVSCYQRVFKPTGPFGPVPGGYWYIERCLEPSCCVFIFEVCMDDQGRINPFPPQIIGNISPPVSLCIEPCYQFCQNFPKYSLFDDEISDSDIEITIEPYSEKMIVHLNGEKRGKVLIKLSDLLGKIIINSDEPISDQNNVIINLENLKTGTYVYLISLDGERLANGKFNVIK